MQIFFVIAGIFSAVIAALAYIAGIIESIVQLVMIVALCILAIIAYFISEILISIFDWNFWIIFSIVYLISIFIAWTVFMKDSSKSKKEVKENKINNEELKKVEEDKSMGLLNSAKNAVSSATEKVKDSVSENVKDKVLHVGKSVVAESVKDSFFFSHNKDIDRMNVIRFNSSHLSDEQLIDYVKNKSIDLYEKMGYAAAFADRYPPKNKI